MTYWEGNARYSDGTVITKLRNYRNDVSEADQQYQLESVGNLKGGIIMVNTYGAWTYEKNTAEEKKCDCDRLADWIISTGYQVETSIEYLTEMIISYATDWFEHEYGNWEYNLDDVIEYVENSGGITEFDFYC